MDAGASLDLARLLRADTDASTHQGDGATTAKASASSSNSVVSVELVTRLAQRLSASQDRIAKLVRIEKAIADFHGEVVALGGDRQGASTDKGSTAATPVTPSVGDGDTLALIHSLRTYMRMHVAFRDDYEAMLKSSLKTVSAAKFNGESSAKEQAAQLTLERDALLRDKQALLDQMDETEAVKALLTAQTMEALEQSHAAKEHLLHQLANARTDLKKAQDVVAQLDEKEQVIVGLTQKLESMQRSTVCGDQVAKAMPKGGGDGAGPRNVNQDPAMRQSNLKISYLEAENQAHRSQIKELKVKLQGYTSSTHAAAFAKAQTDAARFKERVNDMERKLATAEATLMKTRGELAEKGSRLQALQAEYDKIFTALQRESDKKREHAAAVPETVSDHDANRIANENQYVAGFYRSKLDHQAAEILALRKQIKKMLTQQHQTYFDHSLHKKEHMRLLTRYAELKRLGDMGSGATTNQQLHHASSVPALHTQRPDVDNIKQLCP
ncbi:hypothetical protein H310_03667 [Aphanomyces invadans]|uniref:Uncharacterized protein n=1 Tax=Aphanomyces invadans TaxID=157072 RepID=A0A024UJN4_9STRA|nr:hypothetical protein H310_03667 [Aphanomyces invadans]ETW06072.1 hypothetical protein H310_03667 [Aphanomyces invadans]|eukprot:XP_008865849.1 hypothetical protein H310_03667 [Aphanomyces invadans]